VTDDRTEQTRPSLDRRHALAGAAGLGLGLPLLAACGGGSSGSGTDGGSGTPKPGTELGKAADVPVGGGTIFSDAKVVVTQPSAGKFLGFSAVCTHMGCTVATVSGGTINCPCHGSKFSVEDGSVESGPAPSPLPSVKVTVKAGELRLA
jgi:Rieske Fe-S protein